MMVTDGQKVNVCVAVPRDGEVLDLQLIQSYLLSDIKAAFGSGALRG